MHIDTNTLHSTFTENNVGCDHTIVINFSVFMISTSCLCSGSLPKKILLLFCYSFFFLLGNMIRPAPGPSVDWPILYVSCLVLHQEEVTLWSAEWGSYLSPVKTLFYCPWLIPSMRGNRKSDDLWFTNREIYYLLKEAWCLIPGFFWRLNRIIINLILFPFFSIILSFLAFCL